MTLPTSKIIEILQAYGEDCLAGFDIPEKVEQEFPEIGDLKEGETAYTTSLTKIFHDADGAKEDGILDHENPRLRGWMHKIEEILEDEAGRYSGRHMLESSGKERKSPDPHCAWYCPIHFFRHGWGIYIREQCILDLALDIALYVNWRRVNAPRAAIYLQLLRSAFYILFLHEQFHHKVESLGFRLLIATGSDRYRVYKANVYRASYLTKDCLEESIANAESYRRLRETRYANRVDGEIRDGLRRYLKGSMRGQPPGYKQGLNYLTDKDYRDGLHKLQSQILDGALSPTTPPQHWVLAPNMITALAGIDEEIYVVLPQGTSPIFPPASIDPGPTTSTRRLAVALSKHYGYHHVSGGKGSHVKLIKPGSQTIILPGNRAVLSPGVVKEALSAIGGYPLSKLPDVLEGKLPANSWA